jgi:hypothetical protein
MDISIALYFLCYFPVNMALMRPVNGGGVGYNCVFRRFDTVLDLPVVQKILWPVYSMVPRTH